MIVPGGWVLLGFGWESASGTDEANTAAAVPAMVVRLINDLLFMIGLVELDRASELDHPEYFPDDNLSREPLTFLCCCYYGDSADD